MSTRIKCQLNFLLMIYLISLLGFVGCSLQKRVSFLEFQVGQESFKTKAELMDLREMIIALNDSCSDSSGTSDEIPSDVKDKLKLLDTLDVYLDEQDYKMKVVMKAMADEKSQIRGWLKGLKDSLNSNAQNVQELGSLFDTARNDSGLFQSRWNELSSEIQKRLDSIEENENNIRQDLDRRFKEQEQRMNGLITDLSRKDDLFQSRLDKLSSEIQKQLAALKENENLTQDLDRRFKEQEQRMNGLITDVSRKDDPFQSRMDILSSEIKKQLAALKENENLTQRIREISKKLECPDQWQLVNDVCFQYFNVYVDWNTANKKCKELGAKLFEPTSQEKLSLITLHNIWVGATDSNHDGTWRWASSGKPLTLFFWSIGQPDNYGGSQWCLEVLWSKLNDDDCTKENRFVCEI